MVVIVVVILVQFVDVLSVTVVAVRCALIVPLQLMVVVLMVVVLMVIVLVLVAVDVDCRPISVAPIGRMPMPMALLGFMFACRHCAALSGSVGTAQLPQCACQTRCAGQRPARRGWPRLWYAVMLRIIMVRREDGDAARPTGRPAFR
jgi:hypothetical protein